MAMLNYQRVWVVNIALPTFIPPTFPMCSSPSLVVIWGISEAMPVKQTALIHSSWGVSRLGRKAKHQAIWHASAGHQYCGTVMIFGTVHGTNLGESYPVGGLNPSEKYESQLGWLFLIYRNVKFTFQTTNQYTSMLEVFVWHWYFETNFWPLSSVFHLQLSHRDWPHGVWLRIHWPCTLSTTAH